MAKKTSKETTPLPVIYMRTCEDGESVRPLTAAEQENYEPPEEALEALARYLLPVIQAHYANNRE